MLKLNSANAPIKMLGINARNSFKSMCIFNANILIYIMSKNSAINIEAVKKINSLC